MEDNYWDASKKMIAQKDFLADVTRYDRDNISEKVIKSLQPYLAMKEFAPENVQKASLACYGIFLLKGYHWSNDAVYSC
jgi:dynein heavy chain